MVQYIVSPAVHSGPAGNPTKEEFEKEFKSCHLSMRRKLLRQVGNPHDVDDILQEAAVRGLIAWCNGKFARECSFYNWFYRICQNFILDGYRTQKRRGYPESFEVLRAAGFDPAGRGLDEFPDGDIAESQRLSPIEQLIAWLPSILQDTYRLHRAGCPHRVIGEQLGVLEATIKSRLHRSHRMIKTWFEDAQIDRRTAESDLAGAVARLVECPPPSLKAVLAKQWID